MIDWNLASGPSDIMAPYNWATGSTAARGVTGQVNMLDTVGNYFQLTNVQLENWRHSNLVRAPQLF